MQNLCHVALHRTVSRTKAVACSFIAFIALLSGCDGSPANPENFSAVPVATMPQIPPVRQLRITLPTSRFTAIDFMALHGCALQITLGKYQSRLGQFASDSQRLLLDLEYLSLAPNCIALKRSEHKFALAEQLRQENILKLRQLQARIFNATFANTEFQQFWNKPSSCCENTGQFQLTLTAIAAINDSVKRWIRGDYQASNIEFEIQLSEISKGSSAYMHSEVLRQTLVILEMQLHHVSPLEYQRWRALRNRYFRDLYREQR